MHELAQAHTAKPHAHITTITCREATHTAATAAATHGRTSDDRSRNRNTRRPQQLCVLLSFLSLLLLPFVAADSSTGVPSPASGLVGVSFLFALQLDAAGFGLLSNATQFQLVLLRDLSFVLEPAPFLIAPAQERTKVTSMDSGFYASPPNAEDIGGCVSNRPISSIVGWAVLRIAILPSSDPQLAYTDGNGNPAVNITDILSFQSSLASSLSASSSSSSLFCAASFRNVLLHQLSNVSSEIVPVYSCPNTARFSTSMASCADLSNTVSAHNTGYPAAATDSDVFPAWLKLLVLGAIIVVAALCLLALICNCCCKRQKDAAEEQDDPVEEECKEQSAAAEDAAAAAAASEEAEARGMAPAAASSSSSSNLLASSAVASSPHSRVPFSLRPLRSASAASVHVHLPQAAEPDGSVPSQVASPSQARAASAAAPAAISPRSLARLPTYAQVSYLLKLQEQKQAAAAADDAAAASEIPPPPPHPAEEEQDVIQPLGLGDSAASSRAHSRAASRSNLHQLLRAQSSEAPRTPRAARDAARVPSSPSRSPGAPSADNVSHTPSPGAPIRRLAPRSAGRGAPMRRALQFRNEPTAEDTMPY